ncbi:MAG: 4Fe-4S ferredoxin [Candidatus Thorarchaeota archaeon]|nr:4Fe-4S ferredoxin [Candidatus Thorarchaeota archaeon]
MEEINLKHRIFYFTGTGNSLMVAKAITDALGDADVIPIAHAHSNDYDEPHEILGIVFPVYWGGLPLKVLEFIRSLKGHSASYIFAVVTHAGEPEFALAQLRAELQKIGLDLSAGFPLRMPSNYIIDYDAPSESGIQRILCNAANAIEEIVVTLRNRTIHLPSSQLSSYSWPSRSYKQFIERVNGSDEKFWVDENCTECETCVRICPVQNIRMKEGRPEWLHGCQQCLACINWCPESAIQFGSGTESRGRYTNPSVTMEDMEP